MSETKIKVELPPPFPDHTQLPDEDGTFVKNFQEHPQSILLTDSIGPVLQQRHPDGNYAIGQDCGIYWRETEPPEKGAEAPDWFYVPDVPPLLNGEFRRSYSLWREHLAPFIALEFASGDGSEELDKTPLSVSAEGETTKPGKFWVYERIIRISYYGVYIIKSNQLEMYCFGNGGYKKMSPNERGHYFIEPLGVELGIWHGSYQNQTLSWLRWWDKDGNLLLTGAERAEIEKAHAEQSEQRAEQAEQRMEQAEQRAEQAEQARINAVSQLLATGMDVAQVAQILNFTVEEVRQISGG
ncbi:MAG: Uma2 family endonuclease [Okeania sp. SIO3H1]|uniref:Uma2 family endonuclease n=1 Tax=Okeania sp. SIO1I7 TaxID=2607772 RepID=UPI0013C65D90|nr:Uma2 family endonuclease [Okeania sp. SIO1I7]NEN89217.1 Uma2 family endonuclease [Okeania sp. SIO3H1]NET29707.1 Uma2 family endonuclease [Okeania sp. SIO1I7]